MSNYEVIIPGNLRVVNAILVWKGKDLQGDWTLMCH